MKKNYRLFISHSWAYTEAYEKVVKFLNDQNLTYYNHSVPKDDPIHTNGTEKELREAIDAKVKGVSCVVIMAGIYSTHSKWIKKEIAMAIKYSKPIIAVQPWGSEKTSKIVKDNADAIVGWNGKSIVNAIKKHG
jgi:cysteine synthase